MSIVLRRGALRFLQRRALQGRAAGLRREAAFLSTTPAKVVIAPDGTDLGPPIDFNVQSKVEGQESQIVSIDLTDGQTLRAEAGNLILMSEGVEMSTSSGGGLKSMAKRVLTGQNLMVTDFKMQGEGKGTVVLGTTIPSKIIRLSLADYGGSIVCQKGAFLAGSGGIDIQTEFTKMMAGFFGGEGFILQRLTGEGDAFVTASGALIRRDLEPGEVLRVSSGSLVAFSPGVTYDVQPVPGFKNAVFGGEGLFLTSLTGPGTVWLQGLPFDRVVREMGNRLPRGGGVGMPIMMPGMGGAGGEGGEAGEAGSDAAEGAAASEEAINTARDSAVPVGAAGMAGGEVSAAGLYGDAAPEAPVQGDLENEDFSFTDDAGGKDMWKEDSFPEGGGEADMGDIGEGLGEAAEAGKGVLGTIWDIFRGD